MVFHVQFMVLFCVGCVAREIVAGLCPENLHQTATADGQNAGILVKSFGGGLFFLQYFGLDFCFFSAEKTPATKRESGLRDWTWLDVTCVCFDSEMFKILFRPVCD